MCNPEFCPLEQICSQDLKESEQAFDTEIAGGSEKMARINKQIRELDNPELPQLADALLAHAKVGKDAVEKFFVFTGKITTNLSETADCKQAITRRRFDAFGKVVSSECGSLERQARVAQINATQLRAK
jgi:hypothetical protein